MEKKSLSVNSGTNSGDINIKPKLRRLRIQEALLLQSIYKNSFEKNELVENKDIIDKDTLEYKMLLKKVKDSYINLRNLYDEVKSSTRSQELLVELDIEDMKRKVFELEDNIKSFKSYISSELATLKIAEQDLMKQVTNENSDDTEAVKRKPKTQSVNHNAIIPSPVRAMMTCPFKSMEVQDFQEFLKNSPNPYGGWNEYNHNIFVKYWQKFFGKNYSPELDDGNIQQSLTYELFIEEVMSKVQGLTLKNISAHVKWYTKYIFLKHRQQNAINKWKWSKTTSKKLAKQVKLADIDDVELETAIDDNNFIACTLSANRYQPGRAIKELVKTNSFEMPPKPNKQRLNRTQSIMKPTKQWLNRNYCDDVGESINFNSIEGNPQKLGIPQWRRGML